MAEYIEREALKELVKKHFKLAIDAGMHMFEHWKAIFKHCADRRVNLYYS